MPAGLLRLRKPSVVIRKKEEGRGKNATGNLWDLTYTRNQEKGR
jgi:hypothetical protein